MSFDIYNIKGTDINYYFICRRRAWMSLKSFYILDGNQFVQHGHYLSGKKRRYGYTSVRIGRNEIDNLEITLNNEYIVHEFKRGKKALQGDIFQCLHYMNLLKNKGFKVDHGVIHLLGTKNIRIIELENNLLEELYVVYDELEKLKNIQIPGPVRNYYCGHGCSYNLFCWG